MLDLSQPHALDLPYQATTGHKRGKTQMSTTTYKKAKKPLSKAKKAELAAARKLALEQLGEDLAAYEGTLTDAEKTAIYALHDGYSPRNALLIAKQRPGATDVRGYREWQHAEPPRHVVKGEHGIHIFAPAGTYSTAAAGTDAAAADSPADGAGDSKTFTRFRVASVFDITQTMFSADLPPSEPVNWELEFADNPDDL